VPTHCANTTITAIGVLLFVSQVYGHVGIWADIPINFTIPTLSISISLNVLLTVLIVIRLVPHCTPCSLSLLRFTQ